MSAINREKNIYGSGQESVISVNASLASALTATNRGKGYDLTATIAPNAPWLVERLNII